MKKALMCEKFLKRVSFRNCILIKLYIAKYKIKEIKALFILDVTYIS